MQDFQVKEPYLALPKGNQEESGLRTHSNLILQFLEQELSHIEK